jgi:hypothetical protein
MKNIRQEVAFWAQAAIIISLWVGLVYLAEGSTAFSRSAVTKVPDVVLAYGVLYFVFTKWLWRLPLFQGWLVPFPDVEGTWEGELRTTWVDPATGQAPGPIRTKLVIRQSFSSMSCVMYTAESSSHSTAAAFHVDDDSGTRRISYVYTSTPRVGVRERSAVHDGATTLRLLSGSPMRLEGEYWTNRKSTGELTFTFRDRNTDQSL